MKKNLISGIIICVLLLNLAMPASASEATEFDEGLYTYTVLNGEATITAWDDWGYEDEAIQIPATLGGYPVTAIGEGAFENVNDVTEITVPNGVKTLEKESFYAVHDLKKINLPDTITVIGEGAFHTCDVLTDVTLPKSLETIGEMAFYGCESLTKITIPASCKVIEEDAFAECYLLENVTIENGLQRIEGGAFFDCVNLKEIAFPKSLIEYDIYMGDVFDGCVNLKSINVDSANPNFCSVDGVMYSKDMKTMIKYPPAKADSAYTIPDTMTGSYFLFEECVNLQNIYVNAANTKFTSVDGVLFSKDKTKLFRYPAGKKDLTYTIPDGTTIVWWSSFSDCTYLNEVIFSSGVKTLQSSVFRGCSNLEKVFLNDGLSIDRSIFIQCSKLKNVRFPAGITSIPKSMFDRCSSLSEIDIPDTVTEIGTMAFYECSSLELIELPSGIEKIESSTFSGCTALKSIDIPENVSSIGSQAFRECTSLMSVKLPEKLTKLEDGLFMDCLSLSSISVPDNVTTIEASVFSDCDNLEYIELPVSLESIDRYAFGYDNTNDLKVYYKGSESDWNKISLGNVNFWNNATIFYNSYFPKDFVFNSGASVPNTEFKFTSGTGIGKGTFDYSDDYFKGSSYKYNHELARLSVRAALAAYGNKNNYKNAYVNIENMMSNMGFDGLAHNDWYEQKPTTESIGVAVGKKHISYPDGNYTLLAVAVRGGGYEAEWGGNFNVGNEKHHAGFAQARDQVKEFIQNYIKEQKIGGNIKLWITGYSRAAATANLTAAYFDEHPEAIGSMVTLTPKNIYAYCFETPMGVKNPDNESGLYDNIFSIVNQHDFVPKVAMHKWGFDRYGVTKYLPTAFTNKDYNPLVRNLRKNFSSYCKKPYIVDDLLCYYMTAKVDSDLVYVEAGKAGGMGIYLDNIMDTLADVIGSPEEYTQNYQDAFIYAGEYLLGYEDTEEIMESFVKNLEEDLLTLVAAHCLDESFDVGYGFNILKLIHGEDVLYTVLKNVVKETFQDVGVSVDASVVDKLVQLCIDVGPADIYTAVKHGKGLKQGHYPELCIAWLDTIGEADYSSTSLRSIFVNCPVDFEVYDSNNKLVAAVYNNVPAEIEDSSVVAYVDKNGQKVVYLPTDEEYRIEMIATDDGAVTYSVQEHNITTGKTEVINYSNMSVSKNDVIIGKAENLSAVENATYQITSDTVTLSEQQKVEDAKPISVAVSSEGNGTVSGGGTLYEGEFARVTAVPFENETFLGWYNGEELVSSELTYRFQVTEKVTLTAKFTENTCAIIFLTEEGGVLDVQRVFKGNPVKFPEFNHKADYLIKGFYADKELTVPADEDAVYSQNTTIYTKGINQDEWVQFDKDTNDITIYSPENKTAVKLIVAIYEGEKIIDVKCTDVELTTMENVFDSPFTGYGNADTVKVFVWESESDIKPIFDVYSTAVSSVKLTDIAFEEKEISVYEGVICRLNVIPTPSNALYPELVWQSSDETCVEITDGKIYAKSPGSASVSIETVDGSFSDECIVTVKDVADGVIFGDVNGDGDVNSTDMLVIKMVILGKNELTDYIALVGDVNGDNILDEADNELIKQYILEVIDTFPIEERLNQMQ